MSLLASFPLFYLTPSLHLPGPQKKRGSHAEALSPLLSVGSSQVLIDGRRREEEKKSGSGKLRFVSDKHQEGEEAMQDCRLSNDGGGGGSLTPVGGQC